MGDRTYVSLFVPLERKEEVIELMPYGADDENDHQGLQFFGFTEVNYGELDFLPALVEVGIPYDSQWEPGGEYGKGTEYGRFTPDGDFVKMTVYDDQINPSMKSLLEVIDDFGKLRAVILEHQKRTSPMGWENQLEYGKLYRAKKLIAPD